MSHPFFSIRKIEVQTIHGKTLLNPVEFDLEKGQVLGVYGPNGSGKSTFLRAVAGVSSHFQAGEVWIEDFQVKQSQNPKKRAEKIIYLGSEYACPFDVRVRDLLDLGEEFFLDSLATGSDGAEKNRANSKGRSKKVRELFNLDPMLSRIVSTLSDGEKQWVMFARALIQNPTVLALDESFSKLDLDRLVQVIKIIQQFSKAGMTFLIASHDLNFLSEASDALVLFKSGKALMFGPIATVFCEGNFKQLYPDLNIQFVKSELSGKNKIII